MTTAMRALRPRLAQLLMLTIAALYVLLLVAAVTGAPWLFLAVLLASQAVDEFVNRRSVGGRAILRRLQFGQSNRALLREVLLLVLVARHGSPGAAALVAVGVAVLALMTGRGVLVALDPVLRAVSTLPVETRNVPMTSPELVRATLDIAGDAPLPDDEDAPYDDAAEAGGQSGQSGQPVLPGLAGLTARFAGWRTDTASALFTLSGLVVVGGTLAAAAGAPWLVAGLAVAATAAMLARARHVLATIRARRAPGLRDRYLGLVAEQVRALAPEVILYFSGSRDSAYQLNMWLPVLAATDRRPLVMLRERVHLSTLGPTNVPVVCLPDPVDVMNFALPTARVALYVANVGKNIHLLREPRLKHVFIGHGDSDKVASVNPFSKVHDEIWVAGRAARERYRLAQVGVRDDSVVEVGRPQLDAIVTADAAAAAGLAAIGPDGARRRPLTVLYAPTWEGWTSSTAQTSLVTQGVALVTALLDPRLDVRVVFKPHPLTGTVSPQAAAALRSIERLLLQAGGLDTATRPGPEPTGDPVLAAERAQAWSERFWAALPPQRHVVVRSAAPTLFDCFNRTDLLVGDISSVVSDFVASEKPYVVTNPDAVPEHEFRAANPSTSGAYLLTPGGPDVAALVALVRGDDPLRTARRAAREHLLGPADPPSIVRWNAAVERLWATSEAQWGPVGAAPGPVTEGLVAEAAAAPSEAVPADAVRRTPSGAARAASTASAGSSAAPGR